MNGPVEVASICQNEGFAIGALEATVGYVFADMVAKNYSFILGLILTNFKTFCGMDWNDRKSLN